MSQGSRGPSSFTGVVSHAQHLQVHWLPRFLSPSMYASGRILLSLTQLQVNQWFRLCIFAVMVPRTQTSPFNPARLFVFTVTTDSRLVTLLLLSKRKAILLMTVIEHLSCPHLAGPSLSESEVEPMAKQV